MCWKSNGTLQTARRALALGLLLGVVQQGARLAQAEEPLRVGLAAIDITPDVQGPRPVWMAGQENNRRAQGVRAPLFARALVLVDGPRRVALTAVDLIGLPYTSVQKVRAALPGYVHLLVASTHNHEGPDVIGIWGPKESESGVDPEYLTRVEGALVEAIGRAEQAAQPAQAHYGTASDVELLGDYRLPHIFDPVLRAIRFTSPADGSAVGLLVQWNSHPVEPDGNHDLTPDFMGATVRALEARYHCPVIYFSGAVGGLMGTPGLKFLTGERRERVKNVYDFIEVYGQAVADLATQACDAAMPCRLTPVAAFSRPIAVPMTNRGYRLARAAGVLPRPAYAWTGNFDQLGEPLAPTQLDAEQAVESEVAYLRLGELHVAAIPGELYPELVYGEIPPTPVAGVDFPEAPPEGCVMKLLPGEKTLLLGLANDELGYIIPRRQWDEAPPYAYDRDSPQYGERNSLGPDTARTLLEALARRVEEAAAQAP